MVHKIKVPFKTRERKIVRDYCTKPSYENYALHLDTLRHDWRNMNMQIDGQNNNR